MTSFAALMKMAKATSSASEASLRAAQREREEAAARERRERERKEREAKELADRLARKARERAREEEARREKLRKEREERRREEEELEGLRKGRKPLTPGSTSTASLNGAGGSRARSTASPSDSEPLTREEKRKLAQLRQMGESVSRKTVLQRSRLAKPERLKGGAYNTLSTSSHPSASVAGDGKTARARLVSSMDSMSGLVKLNQQKRDLRTIDEIEHDLRAKRGNAKTPAGPIDFFAGGKKRDASAERERERSRERDPKKARLSAPTLGKAASASSLKSPRSSSSSAAAKASSAKSAPTRRRSPTPPSDYSDDDDSDGLDRGRSRGGRGGSGGRGGGGGKDISSEIWQIFGKRKEEYLGRDYNSDDEDMEAGAEALRAEELRSMRAAKKEDEMEEEAERRREADKRRRRKEKEKAGKGKA